MLSSASDKAKLCAKNFSKNSNLYDTGISLPVFPSRTILKLHISVTPKLVKKFTTNLDLSKASGPDYIPVVVLKNCEPELSYIPGNSQTKWEVCTVRAPKLGLSEKKSTTNVFFCNSPSYKL